MTIQIFIEFLRWFDMKMNGRKVALLIDNFSAHQAAAAEILLLYGFLRTHWKQYWVKYILCEFEANWSPVLTMDVLKAIRWGLQGWESMKSLHKLFKTAFKRLLILKYSAASLWILQ